MKALKSALIGAGVAALMAALSAGPAAAEIVENFTWNPSAAAPSLGTTQFTANSFGLSDYAMIDLGAPSAPGVYNNGTENAILGISGLSLTGGTAPGFIPVTGTGGAGNGTTDYQLYFTVTASSSITLGAGCAGGVTSTACNASGQFNSFTYSLIEDVGGKATFSANAAGVSANTGTDNQIVLATGSLNDPSASTVTITKGVPGASAYATINVDVPGFFVSPSDFNLLNFETVFNNTRGETSSAVDGSGNPEIILGEIGSPAPGGGTADVVAVPEPLTLSLFGAGLAGAAALRRRKSKKA